MNITHYYFDKGFCTSLKNNLQKEAKTYLESLDKSVICAEDLEEAKKVILDSLEQINKNHPRCKPLKPYWDNHEKNHTFYLAGFYEVTFHLRAGELKHLSRLPYRSLSNN